VARCFDRYVAVDWSASSTPKLGRDSIWVAIGGGGGVDLHNLATRAAAAALLDDLVASAHDRVLIGFDFPFGYPTGMAAALGLRGHPATAVRGLVTEVVIDDDRNRNNRFEVAGRLNRRIGDPAGPFWGRPAARFVEGLDTTKPRPFGRPELRSAERWCRANGRYPFSCWQLLGAGSVGGQVLVGLPVLERLDRHPHAAIWPFDGDVGHPGVLLAEIWPSAFPVDLGRHPVKDAAQVGSVVEHLAVADRRGELAGWFALPDDPAIRAEEAWMLLPGGGR
jgi:precorrin-8X/cobalt-precorrin-8 methylmutase